MCAYGQISHCNTLVRSDPMTFLIGQTSFETVVRNEQFIYLQCQTNWRIGNAIHLIWNEKLVLVKHFKSPPLTAWHGNCLIWLTAIRKSYENHKIIVNHTKTTRVSKSNKCYRSQASSPDRRSQSMKYSLFNSYCIRQLFDDEPICNKYGFFFFFFLFSSHKCQSHIATAHSVRICNHCQYYTQWPMGTNK